MSGTTTSSTYQPLTLSKRKDGNHYGQVTLFGDSVQVKVEPTRNSTKYYYVHVVDSGGHQPTLVGNRYRLAGLLTRAGRSWHLRFADSRGTIDQSGGYTETGTLALNAERIVSSFLGLLHHEQEEAAKTPEQRAAEAQRIHEGSQAAQRTRISRNAKDLRDVLDQFVSSTSEHFAVVEARLALEQLLANVDSIDTLGANR